jgi:hypothetical protein
MGECGGAGLRHAATVQRAARMLVRNPRTIDTPRHDTSVSIDERGVQTGKTIVRDRGS